VKKSAAKSTTGTSDFIARLTAGAVLVGLACATVLGFLDGNFAKLQAVWNGAAVYVGAIFTRYINDGGHSGTGR